MKTNSPQMQGVLSYYCFVPKPQIPLSALRAAGRTSTGPALSRLSAETATRLYVLNACSVLLVLYSQVLKAAALASLMVADSSIS